MRPSILSRSPPARGFTLVEILVALTIGMVLTLVVAQLFLGSRRTYATTDEASRMQENIRFTYQLLTRTLHMAGYKSSPTTRIGDIFTAGVPVLAGTEGSGTASDTFTVRFQGNSNGTALGADGTVVDCHGFPVAAGVMSTNVFFIAGGANGANALWCNNGVTIDPVTTLARDANLEIVPDVENMQVLYGVDGDTNLVVDNYLPATGLDMNQVRSVRVALLFRSQTEVLAAPQLSGVDNGSPLNLNGVEFGPYTDRRVRRAVTMTVNIRNRTP